MLHEDGWIAEVAAAEREFEEGLMTYAQFRSRLRGLGFIDPEINEIMADIAAGKGGHHATL